MKLKNIGTCKILKKFYANAYGIELPEDIIISPIFNVEDLYTYRGDVIGEADVQDEFHWMQQMPTPENLQI